ncbi:outer membrane lipoprotein chaperone LolA [Motiliproteus sp. MSK22-1]|uniref:outer membrane lipoprotein chaperone LolA n=1 Tax=Motiliproteus sp. MSK22-1 TaxID=1897630 RepID=UPI00097824A0|nr:outer membrane lipoprotein chaperone LolA [Motiliproteus sp. MSK22-1]OMH32721.1 outer membrane lipoprotein carrier protein LolA [Motiliproteus sp. MSK22-1]
MYRPIRYFALFFALLFSSMPAFSGSAAENLNRLLSELSSFSADFEQLVLDNSGSRMQAANGHVELQRPGMFRWRTQDPFPQLLVSDGKQLWLYDEDLEQVTVKDVDNRLGNTPALLLSGDISDLEQNFVISGPSEGKEGVYRLVPKDENSLFVVMRIMFSGGIPVEMQLEDNLGQQTSVAFQNSQFNPDLEPSIFTFTVPDGVDVIGE